MENNQSYENTDLKEKFDKLWRSKNFQKASDIIRIVMLGLVLVLIVFMVMHVREIKVMYDPCGTCMKEIEGVKCVLLKPNQEILIIGAEEMPSFFSEKNNS